MKVAVDSRNLIGSRAGVGRYLQNLLEHFTSLCNHSFYIYSHREVVDRIIHVNYHYMVLRGHPLFWKQVLLPLHQLRHNYDLLFVPTYSSPVFFKGKVLLTVHDLIFAKYPQWANWKQSIRFSVVVPMTIRRADCLIAVSETTANDIIALTGIPHSRIEVVHLGVDKIFCERSESGSRQLREKYKIDYPYILHVGSIHPRRNIKRLIEAFLFLKNEKKIAHHLILIGLNFHRSSEFRNNSVHRDIHYFGFVPDDDLVDFYSQAEIFVYPSLYEGFGLPVIEAMACGTPVITSNVSSLPEVAGDAALLVDPESTGSIADAIQKLIFQQGLRRELIDKGRERSAQFTWEKASLQTCQIMDRLIS